MRARARAMDFPDATNCGSLFIQCLYLASIVVCTAALIVGVADALMQ